jgi:plasmid maintenance system antidote protein VapI
MEPAGDKDLELMIYKIKDTDAEKIAEVLNVTKRQAFNIKGGYTALSYEKALLLKEKLGLEPEAFAEIRKRFLNKKENNE